MDYKIKLHITNDELILGLCDRSLMVLLQIQDSFLIDNL
jgi:hypothetical protein